MSRTINGFWEQTCCLIQSNGSAEYSLFFPLSNIWKPLRVLVLLPSSPTPKRWRFCKVALSNSLRLRLNGHEQTKAFSSTCMLYVHFANAEGQHKSCMLLLPFVLVFGCAWARGCGCLRLHVLAGCCSGRWETPMVLAGKRRWYFRLSENTEGTFA